MWGAGTAIGELPPYFMARTARLSGEEIDDEQEEDKKSNWYPVKQTIKTLVERVGFLGILACASVIFWFDHSKTILLIKIFSKKKKKN